MLSKESADINYCLINLGKYYLIKWNLWTVNNFNVNFSDDGSQNYMVKNKKT